MRSRLTPLFISAALLASAGSAAAYQAYVVAPTNMHAGPSMRRAVVMTIPANTPFEVMSCRRWCEVQYGGAFGYVEAPLVVAGAPASALDAGPVGLLTAPFAAVGSVFDPGYAAAPPPAPPPVVAAY